jgi:two-component system sensor histidine kinase SenX3
MESGATAYALAPTDVSQLATSVVDDFRTDLRSRGGQAAITVDAPASITVEADASSLSLALWNLLDNAVKYSPADAAVHVAARQGADAVTIAVRDRGYGIPKDEQDMVFGQFARGEVSRRLGIKGTGIGLASVAHVARGHGGEVRVESGEGEGSEFQLVLPLATNVS